MDTGTGYRGRIPFPPLQLTVEEQERCQELTLQLLDQTLRSYDERGVAANGSPLHHSRLASARWKSVKTQHNASLYCERHRGGPHDLHMPLGNWKSPLVLLAVGTIHSCLDDVMLGLTTQSFGDMQLRAASVASQEIRGAMLAKISGPTEENPFNSQSVVWIVGEQKWPLSMVVNPRDFVNLWASGVITDANGDRIGYEVVQPAQLPQCPEIPGSIKRGKFMYGALFREQDGVVDVYIQVHVETMGAVVNAVMMNAIWSSTLGFWKAPRFSEEKKIEWCVITSAVKRANSKRKPLETKSRKGLLSCCRCSAVLVPRNQSEYSRGTLACAACASILCFSCSVKRSIKTTTGRSKGAVTRNVAVVLCRNCLKLVEQERAAKIAWEQYQYRLMYSATDACSSSQPLWGLADDSAMFVWSPDRHFSVSDVLHTYSDGEEEWTP
ncbi:hypothetical protein PPTG_18154 [Phytophthora nicotianae INRA-310]|uniref:FYVE-type domain-containing protein n=1 Tax=Phytophthora nicotianae (strain INRA-310) TaxID=761204 RepID=W2PJE8_PHYN3|nr:hypothetical protein PPTG_18154 [Phytophthora nicotianae INRA-310]ETN00150.1 hypothetical protein PPTG_18154 [Phytophthora nicotianae INRA-310]